MNEVLTRAEMEAQFDGEWVLVADPELDKNLEVLCGRVIYHGKDRDAMYDCDAAQQIQRAAYLYFGEMPTTRIWLSGWRYMGSQD